MRILPRRPSNSIWHSDTAAAVGDASSSMKAGGASERTRRDFTPAALVAADLFTAPLDSSKCFSLL
jgi:hypothetical protein